MVEKVTKSSKKISLISGAVALSQLEWGVTADGIWGDGTFNAGMRIFAIFQGGTPSLEYFTNARGKSDARKAIEATGLLGIPEGEIIYYAVDFDILQVVFFFNYYVGRLTLATITCFTQKLRQGILVMWQM